MVKSWNAVGLQIQKFRSQQINQSPRREKLNQEACGSWYGQEEWSREFEQEGKVEEPED